MVSGEKLIKKLVTFKHTSTLINISFTSIIYNTEIRANRLNNNNNNKKIRNYQGLKVGILSKYYDNTCENT